MRQDDHLLGDAIQAGGLYHHVKLVHRIAVHIWDNICLVSTLALNSLSRPMLILIVFGGG